MMLLTLSHLLACTGGKDTGEALVLDPGWTLGAVQPCAAPSDLSFRDASSELGELMTFDDYDERGAIGHWTEADREWIFHTTGPCTLGLRSWSSDGGTATEVDVQDVLKGFVLNDIDQDGRVDMVSMGRKVQVIWGVTTAEPEILVLQEERQNRAVYDIAVADVDGDDAVDLIFGTNVEPTMGDGQEPLMLLRNLGQRSFAEPEAIAASESVAGAVFDLRVVDINADGAKDLYVCNDFGGLINPNYLLLNDGSGSFTVAADDGLGLATDCMGVSEGDLDGDGSLDFVLTAIERNHLLLSQEGIWFDSGVVSLPPMATKQMGWGSAIVDVDNDGLQDILMATSDFSVPNYEPYPLWFLQQSSSGQFQDVGAEYSFPQSAATRAVLTRDLNGDGVVDILASDFLRSPWLLLSEGCTSNNWLEVRGPAGSVVEVHHEGRIWLHLLADNPGFAASRQPSAHIGLGALSEVSLVRLRVPTPEGERVADLPGPIEVNRTLTWEFSN